MVSTAITLVVVGIALANYVKNGKKKKKGTPGPEKQKEETGV